MTALSYTPHMRLDEEQARAVFAKVNCVVTAGAGAGKTTTIRILTGYMPPTSGKVTIGGYDVIDQSLEVRRIVGYLPESVPLYPDMRVDEYLRYMGKLRQLDHLDDRVDTVIQKVNLTDRAHSFISKLSKGMRQRVGLAQALIHEPEVLILDEPTIGLDPASNYRGAASHRGNRQRKNSAAFHPYPL